jgi:hypothetical protein
MFDTHIDDWSYKHWTSNLRAEAQHPRFVGREKDYSDFTYVDGLQQMRTWLDAAGVDIDPSWSDSTCFHLEVKTTTGSELEPAYVSQNQVNMVNKCSSLPCILPRISLEALSYSLCPQFVVTDNANRSRCEDTRTTPTTSTS